MDPFATEVVEIDGRKVAYRRKGSGEPVLLVHGITTYSFIWKNVIPLLENDYDVVAVDLPGCGASDKSLDQSFSIKSHAHLLKKFLDRLGLTKIHFVGHDVGGGIGQVFAVNYQAMLLDLTLINSVAYDFWPVQPIVAMRTPIIRQLAMASLDIGAFRMVVKRGLFRKSTFTPELMDYFWEPMKTRAGRKAFLHFAACLDNRHLLDISDDLQRLELPVLIIRGDADPYLSGAIAEKLAGNIPKSTFCRIPDGSHFIQEDTPERIAQELKQFWEEK